MYQCRHFIIQELVSPAMYKERGNASWGLFDDRLLISLDALRDRYGPCIINDWHNGGARKWSGLRTPESPYYSPTSQHTFGRAADCLFLQKSAEEVRQDLIKVRAVEFPYITGLELNVNWVHVDVRNHTPLKVF